MAVISITAVPSTKQYVSGIPATVTLTTNIPSMVFYTIDGTAPTITSTVYVGAITLPTNQPSVTLRVLATNGSDVDGTLNVNYSPNWINNRVSHAKVTILSDSRANGWCGSVGQPQEVLYGQPAAYTVHQAGVPDTEVGGYGSDPSIYPVWGANDPIPIFSLKYSETDALGRIGDDIGTLPKKTIVYIPPPPGEDNMNKATFNPRAWVLYQDGTKPDENDYMINRQFFDSENFEKAYDGSMYNNSVIRDGANPPRGVLTRYLYNQKNNTITFYYVDTSTGRWIVSTEIFRNNTVTNAKQGNFLGRFMLPTHGNGFVFKWNLFKRTALI